jgi:hypothetical protein
LRSLIAGQLDLTRILVANTLTSRSSLYASPELQAFSGNGGNKINQKIQQLLRKWCAMVPGAETIVDEEVKKLSGGKSRGKASPAQGGSPTKKRKVKDEAESE